MKDILIEQLKGKKILIATVPADGHFNPLTGIAKALQGAGCDVRWYTSPVFRSKLTRLQIPFFPFKQAPDINALNVDNIYPERKLIVDAGEKANFDMVNIFCAMARGNFRDIKEIFTGFHFDAVIADSVFPAIPLLRKLDVPVLSIGVMPLAEESDDLGPYGPGLPPAASQEEKDIYCKLKEFLTNAVFKEAIDTFSDILREHEIPHGRSVLFDTLIKHADLYLQIGSPSFEYKRSDLGDNIRFIGALLPYADKGPAKIWKDERLELYKRIVLVTQGTVEKDTSKILEPTLDAFKNSDTLVIAVTGGQSAAALREKYPFDNIIIEDFIPFAEVMPYASAYITNGGYGGTLLSIVNELPLVTAGLHEGKSEICSRVGYFNYGINLNTETPTAEAILDAVEQVIAEPFYKQNVIKLAIELKSYDSEDLVAEYLLEVINSNNLIADK